MKTMSKSGIYKITNTHNGHRYVGSAVSLTHRWYVHRYRLRRGTHGNPHLQAAWNKYGELAFEFHVIGTCPPEDLLRMEQHLLDDLQPEYNICLTAGSTLGRTLSPETRSRMSAEQKGKKRAPYSLEARANMSAAQKGKKKAPFSFEARANMGAAQKRRRALEKAGAPNKK